MSNGRSISATVGSTDAKQSATFIQDFLALIKIGIVNSNMITVFTGFFLAIQLSEAKF